MDCVTVGQGWRRSGARGGMLLLFFFGFMDLNYTVTSFFQIIFCSFIFAFVSGLWNVFLFYTRNCGKEVEDLKCAQLVGEEMFVSCLSI